MVSEIVHSVLSDNTNRRVTTIEETATKTATTATVKQPKKKAGTSRKNASSTTPAPTIPSDNELVGKSCPLCGKGTIIKGKPRMAAQNGKRVYLQEAFLIITFSLYEAKQICIL